MSVLETPQQPTLETTHRKRQGDGYASLDIEESEEGGERPEPPLRTKREFHQRRRRLQSGLCGHERDELDEQEGEGGAAEARGEGEDVEEEVSGQAQQSLRAALIASAAAAREICCRP